MQILKVFSLKIPKIKVIQFGRFNDDRGYFTETFRQSDIRKSPETSFLKDVNFVQNNESYSKQGTIRGMHFQWNPPMGKLVRTIRGRMVDLILDIRKGSPTEGKMIAYDMVYKKEYNEWIWVPPGFAHGNLFTKDTLIEYFCSGEYNPDCESGISPLAKDIDWSICDKNLKRLFDGTVNKTDLMSHKDRHAQTYTKWINSKESNNFRYEVSK